MGTVLLATDGSDVALDALQRGIALLGRSHRFALLSVVAPTVPVTPSVAMVDVAAVPMTDYEGTRQVEASEESVARTMLQHTAGELGLVGDRLVSFGDPAAEICRVAVDIGDEVLVIGSRGHGWLQRLVLGSVTTYVVRHAPCAVLVVRHADDEHQGEATGDATLSS
jgi:nucleotide-binding universal stress UspA family protein